MISIGWVVLSEQAGHEIVFGAVTQPWVAAPVFRSIPADWFRDFCEPGFVKIVWTLRADPVDAARSIFIPKPVSVRPTPRPANGSAGTGRSSRPV